MIILENIHVVLNALRHNKSYVAIAAQIFVIIYGIPYDSSTSAILVWLNDIPLYAILLIEMIPITVVIMQVIEKKSGLRIEKQKIFEKSEKIFNSQKSLVDEGEGMENIPDTAGEVYLALNRKYDLIRELYTEIKNDMESINVNKKDKDRINTILKPSHLVIEKIYSSDQTKSEDLILKHWSVFVSLFRDSVESFRSLEKDYKANQTIE